MLSMDNIKKYGVIGHPIAHSLSPEIHHLFAKQFQINLDYQKYDVQIEQFRDAIGKFILEGFDGLNVTLPLKKEAYALSNHLSERANLTKSVNTLTFKDGLVYGDSTDGKGFVDDLKNKNINLADHSCLIIGAGGAANGIIFDIIKERPKLLTVTNRTQSKARELINYWQEFAAANKVKIEQRDIQNLKHNFTLIINATSAGILSDESPINTAVIKPDTACYDLTYGFETAFLRNCRNSGAKCFDGMGMLINQAAESFFLWHNLRPNLKDLEI